MTATGAQTPAAALREIMPHTLPDLAVPVPDEIPAPREARSDDRFIMSSLGERSATVALRDGTRIGASFDLMRTEAGGWVVLTTRSCMGLLAGSRLASAANA